MRIRNFVASIAVAAMVTVGTLPAAAATPQAMTPSQITSALSLFSAAPTVHLSDGTTVIRLDAGDVAYAPDLERIAPGTSVALSRAQRSGTTEISQPIGQSGTSRVVIRYESDSAQTPGGITPQFSVGLGWYIYVYLSRSDWIYLAGLGAAAGAAALCVWLTPTVGGAIACAVAAYIVSVYVVNRTAPPVGYCREFRFLYTGTFVGMTTVKMSC